MTTTDPGNKGPRSVSWLVDSAADVHVCNDRNLMTETMISPQGLEVRLLTACHPDA